VGAPISLGREPLRSSGVPLRSISLGVLLLVACGPDIPPRAAQDVESETPRDDTQGRLEEELARVRVAMRELCGAHCGSVVLIAEPGVRSAETRPQAPGYASFIAYNPRARDCARHPDASIRFYCMAHEYGHHLDVTMNPAWSSDGWTRELRADALAGCAFARAHVSMDGIQGSLVRAVLLDTPAGRARAEACGSDGAHPGFRFSWDALHRGARLCGERTPTLPEVAESVDALALAARSSSNEAFSREAGGDCSPR
jgi:hypothetical protein